jgi:valyl-tRNA synthetase
MDKQYDFNDLEPKMLELWEQTHTFVAPTPDEAIKAGMKPFTIIMPPPNANDPLHIGHAMFVTIEDILTRYHRMKGEAALWLPGTDHAGIETQYVFEKKLNKAGKSRFSYDRETLYQMIWDYVQENSETAIGQMKRLGASADWSKTVFMLDPEVVDLVLSTFERMHADDLVYRGLRLINYCTKCGTGYSELEINHEERMDPLYYLKYGPFELATVRPETKFGDTALAVNPQDTRYQDWIGKDVEVEGLLGRIHLRVIADEYVDPAFGTGVVKITPAHDPNDFEVGKRHDLEVKQVIGFDGKLNDLAGPYAGMKVAEARKRVVADLQEKGLIAKVDEQYRHNVGTCYRCSSVIEPLPLPQFFVKVKPLTEKVLAALDSGETKVIGAGHDKILRHWLYNLNDWNISRQVVWGIRMPVWYQIDTSHQKPGTRNSGIVVGFLDEEGRFVKGEIGNLICKHDFGVIEKGLQTLMAPPDADYVVSRDKPNGDYLQEMDTFDTWFSSSQWPVNVLKIQDTRNKKQETSYFDYYYPTSVMETGYDILPFWVMRMMMVGIYLTGHSPFEWVYLHGLVRDEKGQKMSKSKGNAINPLDLVETYGADALRMALVMSTTAGHDSNMGEGKVRGMRNLGNKIWNASRFVQMKRELPMTKDQGPNNENIQNTRDQQEKLRKITATITKQLNELKVGLAAETVYNEFWHWWCDEVLEGYKTPHSASASRGEQETSLQFLEEGTQIWLKLLHPFVPFVTEAVWQELWPHEKPLALQEWPKI